MALTTCRECSAEVSDQARACPRCGAPQPANPAWSGTGFEWKSSRTYGGFPLVHIALGRDSRGKWRGAKGVTAIGQVVLAYYGLGQIGLGKFLWTTAKRDAEAVQFFLSWWSYLKQLIH